jgi:hypothetical protein
MPHPELRVDGWLFLKQASVMAEMSEQLLIAQVPAPADRQASAYPVRPGFGRHSDGVRTIRAQPIRDFVPLLVERRADAELA